jgi:hypothetical protein
LDIGGDTSVRLDERIHIDSKEARRFLGNIRAMAENLLDNIEFGFGE